MSGVATVVDVSELIDRQKISKLQVWVIILCALALFADGFDAQAIGYVAPSISKSWSLPAGTLGPVFGAGLFGLMLGALVLGPLADRVGRKIVIVSSMLAFGLCTVATAMADSVSALLVIRFVTGLGLGGVMPNTVSLTSEYGPRRSRATMVMVMYCGFSLGAALGGAIAAKLIPLYGWRSVFWVGGLFPMFLVPIFALVLPESLLFLVANRGEAKAKKLLSKICPKEIFPENVVFATAAEKAKVIPVGDLFGAGRGVSTVLLWVMYFMNLLDLYFMSNWLPTIINNVGQSVENAAAIGSLFQVGGTIGTLTLGWLMDRYGPKRILTPTFILGCVFVAATGSFGTTAASLSVLIFSAGFCIVGAQIAMIALAGNFYPTFIRSTGVGWCFGIGRIGSIIGPVVGGLMLSLGWKTPTIFLACALPLLVAAVAVFAMASRQTNSK